jgi:hypothetical protein
MLRKMNDKELYRVDFQSDIGSFDGIYAAKLDWFLLFLIRVLNG